MTGICLRPARSTDAGKLGAMITHAVEAHAWKPKLHTGAEDIAHAGHLIDRGWVTVATDDRDRVLGFIARDDHLIHSLYVHREAQRLGVGKALLNDAKARTERLDLWTFEANKGAQRFYRREGFAEVQRTAGENEEGLPDIRFVWTAPADAPASPASAGNAQ